MVRSSRARAADHLHSVAIHVLRYAREADRASGVSPARLSALSVLVYGGARTIGELADAEHVRPPTMTRIVAGLEADGLARRERSHADARSTVVRATPKGERVLERARAARLQRIEALLQEATTADLGRLEQVLTAVFGTRSTSSASTTSRSAS